ncbi:hypothetical protein K0M31_009412 [Melipona bicolor]|uniref:Uncharacterized protein n=1 Tax=Melipona bicolor TaxID=60889 RepID=A0AA40FNH9_9HYME|nr:hypothetical protein K0M31_009412 [Melipona bicolor]
MEKQATSFMVEEVDRRLAGLLSQPRKEARLSFRGFTRNDPSGGETSGRFVVPIDLLRAAAPRTRTRAEIDGPKRPHRSGCNYPGSILVGGPDSGLLLPSATVTWPLLTRLCYTTPRASRVPTSPEKVASRVFASSARETRE